MATSEKTNRNDLKPGSSAEDAAKLSGSRDFGVHENDVVGRSYTSANTKAADHGAAQPNSYEHDGVRESGAGGKDSGPGASSGGDIDTDIVGIGGIGLSTNIDKQAPQDGLDKSYSDGSSNSAASGRPSTGPRPSDVGQVGGRHEQINVVTAADERTTNTGADQASHTEEGDIDDSFRGEVSSAEASGRDEAGD